MKIKKYSQTVSFSTPDNQFAQMIEDGVQNAIKRAQKEFEKGFLRGSGMLRGNVDCDCQYTFPDRPGGMKSYWKCEQCIGGVLPIPFADLGMKESPV